MVALFKAVPLGAMLTLLVALFIGSGGSGGGVLEVFAFTIESMRLYWSWALFCLGTALAWSLMLMMDD